MLGCWRGPWIDVHLNRGVASGNLRLLILEHPMTYYVRNRVELEAHRGLCRKEVGTVSVGRDIRLNGTSDTFVAHFTAAH